MNFPNLDNMTDDEFESLKDSLTGVTLSAMDLVNYWAQWNNSNKTERFGQYVINRQWPNLSGHTALFYETDAQKAFNLISDKYVV